jgi:glycosyltransferase involved in cell wall biosynthesis
MKTEAVSRRLLVVASPAPFTGGGLRALRSLKEYARYFTTYLFIPQRLWSYRDALRRSTSYIRELRSLGVRLAGFSRLPKAVPVLHEVLGTRVFGSLLPLLIPGVAHLEVGATDYGAVVVLHEVWDAIYSGAALAELFEVPSAVLLQLPPFYSSRERYLNIMGATLLWRELLGGKPVVKELFRVESIARSSVEGYLSRLRYERVLRRYTLILGVSKAVAVEMGGEWSGRVVCLDPGVSLDEEDLEVIRRTREKVRAKGNYLVFGGRPSVDKGLAEALVSFRTISRYFPGMRLVVTGSIPPKTLARVKRVCRRLGIEGRVVFTGFLPRERRFEIVARARLMLYPSHVDSFPYAVLESLHLGTPVLAYRIPAIEIYFGRSPGVELVEEGDVETFTARALDLLERGVEVVEPPSIRGWREIMEEELGIILKLLSR